MKIWQNFIQWNGDKGSRGGGHKCVTVNVSGCEFDPHSRKWNIYLNVYLNFLRSAVEVKAQRWFPAFNTQCFQNSADNGKRSILILGSLCLPCCGIQREADNNTRGIKLSRDLKSLPCERIHANAFVLLKLLFVVLLQVAVRTRP